MKKTKWSKVPCLRKQRDGRGLNPGPPDPEFEVLTIRPHTPPQGGMEAIQSTFRSLEMHSKRHYKTCICSVILGEFESFQNYKGFGIIFSKKLRCNQCITKVRIFLSPLSITFLKLKILGFLFSTKNSLTRRSEMWKIKLQKIEGDLLDKLWIHEHEWNGHLEIFSHPQAIENSRQYLLLRTDIYRKQSLGDSVLSIP